MAFCGVELGENDPELEEIISIWPNYPSAYTFTF